MAHIEVDEVIDAPAEKIWGLIRDFGHIEAWWPKDSPIKIQKVVTEGRGAGMIRHIYYVGVPTPLSERLDFIDENSRSYGLSIVGEGMPGLISYQARGVVTESGPHSCRLDYRAEVKATPEKAIAVEKNLRFGLSQVIAGLKAATGK